MSEQSASKGKTIGILIAALVILAAAAGYGYTQFMGKSGMPGGDSAKGNIQATIEKASNEMASAAGEEKMPEDDVIVAVVDGEKISRDDVLRFMQNQNINIAQQDLQGIYPLALEQVIRGQIVINQAQKANLENDPEVLEQLEGAKKHIINTVFLQRTVDSKITDAVMQGAYDSHISQIPDIEERHARHILLDSEEKAKEVIAKLNEGGDFAQLAQENSIGPTGPNGGDLGYFTKDQMVPSFAEAAFSMEPGEVSAEPVKSEFGFHVIKIEDVRMKPKPTMDEMHDFLQVQLRQEILNEMIDNWEQAANIEKYDMNGQPLEPAAGEEQQPAMEQPQAVPAPQEAQPETEESN